MTLHDAAQRALKQYVEQLEQLESEKQAIADDIKDKFAEIKMAGYDCKIIKQVLKIRKKTDEERSEEEMLLDTYLHALGMGGTPMGDYMERQEAAQ